MKIVEAVEKSEKLPTTCAKLPMVLTTLCP